MFLVCCEKNINNLTIGYIKALTSWFMNVRERATRNAPKRMIIWKM